MKQLCVGKLPYRQRPCRWVEEGGRRRVPARFDSEAAKEEFSGLVKGRLMVQADEG